MKKKLLVVDPLSERSHYSFNIEFISLLKDFNVDWVCSKSEGNKHSRMKALFTFSDFLINKKYRAFYSIGQSIILFFVLINCVLHGKRRVLFVSYELSSMLVFSYFFALLRIKVYLVEHNTIVPNSKVKSLLFKLLNKRVLHICLAPYIQGFIESTYGKKAISIWHPIPYYEKKYVNQNTTPDFFMPSSTISKKMKSEIFNVFKRNSQYNLFAKGTSQNTGMQSNIIVKPFYHDYIEKIISSTFVIIPQRFEYRVSGVFFEALSGSAIILLDDCIFGRAMKCAYNNRVVLVKDWSDFLNTIESLNTTVCSQVDLFAINEHSKKILFEALSKC
jgi:hypothetical protein